MIAKTFHGLENVLAKELEALGAQSVEVQKRAVSFVGDKRMMYRANYELRTALRVLLPIDAFIARNEEELYKGIYRIDWTKYMNLRQSLAVDSVVNSSIFRHSHYCALKTKDAIVDRFRDETGERPYVNTAAPSILINVHIYEDEVTVSLDSSGEPLFKRGYRVQSVDAPINEVLAAGMLLLAGWKGEGDLIDPFCGSGTILAEAALIGRNAPPQLLRKEFGFQKWSDYDAALWKEVVAQAKARMHPFEGRIFGTDIDFKAVRIAENNLQVLGVDEDTLVRRRAFDKLDSPSEGCLIVTNPPYDERLKTEDIRVFYEQIGQKLKRDFKGSSVWLISSSKEGLRALGMKADQRFHLYNGALECEFNEYRVYNEEELVS
jgi:putative N6-adenine-specific DNA methylase